MFHSAHPQISTSICSDSLQPYYRWGADCGNMAKPCSQRSELVTMVAHHPSRIVAWSKIRQCKNAEIHATTCVMSFQAFTILVFAVQYLIFLKGGLLFRKKVAVIKNRLLYASILNVLIVLKLQDEVRFSAASREYSVHHICFVCFIKILLSTSYRRSVSMIHTTIALNDDSDDY